MAKNKGKGKIYIGTSGWLYKDWYGTFYPEDLPRKDWLIHYGSQFDSVELNASFYHTPKISSIETWCQRTPRSFIFSVKCSRWMTHIKRLKGERQDFDYFYAILPAFKKKLGPILYQLPPRWYVDLERLEHFLGQLPKAYRATFEFRDASWFCEEVYDLLRKHNAAFCLYHLDRRRSPHPVTADFVYLRLHGPKGKYKGSYSMRTLAGWAEKFLAWQEDGLDIYCYFDNDEKGYATKDALRLSKILIKN